MIVPLEQNPAHSTAPETGLIQLGSSPGVETPGYSQDVPPGLDGFNDGPWPKVISETLTRWPCAEGTPDNSPTFQRRVACRTTLSPEGTAEIRLPVASPYEFRHLSRPHA